MIDLESAEKFLREVAPEFGFNRLTLYYHKFENTGKLIMFQYMYEESIFGHQVKLSKVNSDEEIIDIVVSHMEEVERRLNSNETIHTTYLD